MKYIACIAILFKTRNCCLSLLDNKIYTFFLFYYFLTFRFLLPNKYNSTILFQIKYFEITIKGCQLI